MNEHDDNLKIDPAIRLLVLPLNASEYAALEAEILTEGNKQPVQCWYNYIISGFERAEICQRHGIPFDIARVSFRSEIEIVALICRRELQERILPSDMRRYLIGKLYDAEKIIAAHKAAGTDRYKERQNREVSRGKDTGDNRLLHIRERLGEQYRLNPATITRYAVYAEGIDTIFRNDPQKAADILSGNIKIPVDVIRGYALSDDPTVYSKNNIPEKVPQRTPEATPAGPSVKDMPEFDPDAEISSLALTIPSWVQSLTRTRTTAKLSLITDTGRQRLVKELERLIHAANKLHSALVVK